MAADAKFRVGSADLEHPGDAKGPAGEVVNCRCVSAASLGPEEGTANPTNDANG